MRVIEEQGLQVGDWKWLELYAEWQRMRSEGHKFEFIVYYLADTFNLSRSSVYRIVKRMEKQVKPI